MKAFFKMLKIEFMLSFRDMNMIIFAIIMPLVITIILGFVYGIKPAFENVNYTSFEQSFGAMASIGIVASGIMGLPLALSDYRDRKILKRFECTPTSASFLLLVQLVKYAIYSFASLIAVYLTSICFGFKMHGNYFVFIGMFCLTMICLFSIGMLITALAKSSQKAGLICSILYFPMLILSGTTVPYEIMPKWLQIVSDFLPLTQGVKLLKGASLNLPLENFWMSIIILLTISIICTLLSVKFFKWNNE